MIDYSKIENMHLWHRHSVLGDPSFDNFEKYGECVHISCPPYEWAVNGSIFIDPKDGKWYSYVALYAYGYQINSEKSCKFIIYCSEDDGRTWNCLGDGFEPGFVFDGYSVPSDGFPDVMVVYDEKTDKYWMSYDWNTNNVTWSNVFNNTDPNADSGGAIAWSYSPAGPFTRLKTPHVSNNKLANKIGRFKRMYFTSLVKRESDWVSLVLCDSCDGYYSWGLAAMVAETPEGPWSDPEIVLSVDRDEYYPAAVEFCPCYVIENKVYAPATSIALNRNYQAVFVADLENCHKPSAWVLENDGNVWHGRNDDNEKYGIWGQTYHIAVKDNYYYALYPSRNQDDYGTISIAKCPVDKPYKDEFTFSGHAGKSITLVNGAYKDFSLKANFCFTGIVEFVFDYNGILGANQNISDATLYNKTLTSYKALKLYENKNYELIDVDESGNINILCSGVSEDIIKSIELIEKNNKLEFYINNDKVTSLNVIVEDFRPVGLVAHEFSVFTCNKFEIDGEKKRYTYFYNVHDGLLCAGQKTELWQRVEGDSFYCKEAFIGEGDMKLKWNLIGDTINVYSPKMPILGEMQVYVDGKFIESINLKSDHIVKSDIVFNINNLDYGRHSLLLKPLVGKIAVDMVSISG